jgi:hypothetical protein
MYSPNCNQTRYWIPTGGATPETGAGVATTYTLNKANQYFSTVKDRMTMIDGINVSVLGGDLHSNGQIMFMTGKPAGAQNLATVPSIDQILIDQSPALAMPQFKSLELICDTRSDRNDLHHRIISYGMDSKPRPGENQPHLAFQRLFGDGVTAPMGVDPAKLLAQDKSVLDFLKGDLDRLYQRIPSAEKPKLDSHLDALREIERTLVTPAKVGGTAMAPTGITALPADTSAVHDKIVDNHFKIIKAAFQFDLTRVVTFSYATGNSYVELDAFLNSGMIHGATHAITHEEAGQDSTRILLIQQWYMNRTAQFIADLAATPDIDGSSMLDNTVVVLFAETSQFHEHENIPLVIFGGQKLGIPGNRVLHYPGRWTNDLWPTLSPIFGVTLNGFGDAQFNRGKLPGLVV